MALYALITQLALAFSRVRRTALPTGDSLYPWPLAGLRTPREHGRSTTPKPAVWMRTSWTQGQLRTPSQPKRTMAEEGSSLSFVATSTEGQEVVISVLGELGEFSQAMDILPADGKLIVASVEITPEKGTAK
jgi:hypothetical protein